MATSRQIAAASARPSRSAAGHAIDRVGEFGDVTYEATEGRRAARCLARLAPDLADILGLELPAAPRSLAARLGTDILADLMRAMAEGEDVAREYARELVPIEAEAARAALRARLEDR